MDKKVSIPGIILIILLINAAGLTLKYYNLDAYFILAGFRLHLSFVFLLFVIYRNLQFEEIKRLLIKPLYNKTLQPLIWIFIPVILLLAALYLTKNIEIGDPDYFYEFGLSSVFDLPVYIIWNLPQVLAFAFFIILIKPAVNGNVLYSFLLTSACFIFYFIPVDKVKPDYIDVVSVVLMAGSAVLILKYFQNVYWFSIVVFMMVWTNVLAFGSSSRMLIHMLFAAHYTSWDGFFEVSKNIREYLLPLQLCITFILIVSSVLVRKTKTDIVEKKS